MSRGVPAFKIMGSLLSKIYLVGLFLLNSWWLSKHLPTARPWRYTTSPAMLNPVGCWLLSGTKPDPDKPANKAMAPTRPATSTGHRHPLPTVRVWKGQLGCQGMEVPSPLPQVSGLSLSSQGDSPSALLWGIFFVSHQHGVSLQETYFPVPGLTLYLFTQMLCANTFSPPRWLASSTGEHLPAWLPVPLLALPYASTHVRAHGLRAPTPGRCFARGLTWLLFSLVWCVQCMSWQHLTQGRGAGHAVPVCRSTGAW